MLISTSHKFIFVHVPKSAGSSVTAVLQPYCLPKNRTLWRRLSSFLPLRENVRKVYFRQHDTAAKIRAKLGPEVFDEFTSFAIVRNPFDHAVSLFEFLKMQTARNSGRVAAGLNFKEFMQLRSKPQRFALEESPLKMVDQASRLVDRHGKIIVTDVLHLEKLADEFQVLCAKLGLPPIGMAVKNASKRLAIEKYYDAAAVALVQSHYARDFALFGYDTAPGFAVAN